MSTPPAYLNSPPSPFPFIELKEDQQIHQFFSASSPPHEDQASSSSLSSPIFFNIAQDQTSSDSPREPPKKEDKYILHGGLSRDHHQVLPSSSTHSTIESTKHDNGLSFCKLEGGVNVEDHERDYESSKWMSSKMMNTKGSDHEKQERIIKIKFHGTQDQAQYSNNNIVRVCSDCKTTKTPLWRSGPQGPKSLCNACGIRQRKARRALLAAAAAANGTVLTTDNPTKTSNYKVQKKKRKSQTSYISQRKKPFSPANGGERISVEDFARSLSKSLAFQRAFPKDEEEAAILLMALSCGLLHS